MVFWILVSLHAEKNNSKTRAEDENTSTKRSRRILLAIIAGEPQDSITETSMGKEIAQHEGSSVEKLDRGSNMVTDELRSASEPKLKAPLKLFGYEFKHICEKERDIEHSQIARKKIKVHKMEEESGEVDFIKASNGSNSPGLTPESRKYECQYCCREFANSQALGGHQKAHKEERQQAKRALIQAGRRSRSFVSNPNPNLYGLQCFPHSSRMFDAAMPIIQPNPTVFGYNKEYPSLIGGSPAINERSATIFPNSNPLSYVTPQCQEFGSGISSIMSYAPNIDYFRSSSCDSPSFSSLTLPFQSRYLSDFIKPQQKEVIAEAEDHKHSSRSNGINYNYKNAGFQPHEAEHGLDLRLGLGPSSNH
ncbi:hypothetical protein SUGI_0038490 [Cryptomeria japonica]|nr:hypothetical protein SUGI_0038490 [Cryptomeria japonica]